MEKKQNCDERERDLENQRCHDAELLAKEKEKEAGGGKKIRRRKNGRMEQEKKKERNGESSHNATVPSHLYRRKAELKFWC